MTSKGNIPGNATELRKRAETIAREKAALSLGNLKTLSLEETNHILHERQVHQIELEMQNEELRRAQTQLDAARARYFDLYDLAPVGYCTVSEKGLILEANLLAATLLGVSRDALVKQPITRFILQEDQDIYYLNRKQLFDTEMPQDFCLRIMKNDVLSFWAHLSATISKGTDGEPVTRIVISDISANKKKTDEEVLRLHEAVVQEKDRLSALVNSISDEIWHTDVDGKFTLVNPSGSQEFALDSSGAIDVRELAAKLEVLRPDGSSRPIEEAPPLRALRGEVVRNQEEIIRTPATGKLRYRQVSSTPIRDAEGNISGSVSVVRDITDSKNAEAALLKSERKLSLVLENMSEGLMLYDADGSVTYQNPASLRIHGFQLSEARQIEYLSLPAIWKGWNEQGLPLNFNEWPGSRVIRGEHIQNQVLRMRRDDTGHEFIASYNGCPIHDDNGKIAFAFITIHDITERKRAEEMRRLHIAIMETVAEGIFLIGLEDNIIKWTNSKFEQLFGYNPGEMVGMHVDKVNAPTEKTPTETRFSIVDILRQTGEWHGEIKSIKKNGTHFWSYIHVSLFNHPEFGTVMVSAHTDITDRKQAEAELQESELRFRTMANAIPQLAWIARADGYRSWYNKRWYDYTGTTPEQMEGWGWQNVHDPNVLPKVLEGWQVSLATSEPFDMAFPLRGADGVFRPFLTRVIPLKDNAGRVIQWFGTNTDISELKRVEQALRESEALYRSIGESIDYGVWICAPDGRNTYASESFLQMVGITQEQCSNFGWGDVLHPDDAERTITAWQECVRTGGTWDIEHRFRGTDGQWHHVLARGVPVRNEQGEIISWAGINLDINRIKQAEEQIRASLTEKEVLLKEVHHRVKNNLQIISSLISLQTDSLIDEQLHGVLADVRNRVRTMALVHEKLYQTEDLSRLDFAEYVRSLMNYLWSAFGAANRNVRLNMTLAPLILPVETAVNCGLILNEMASNAIKHAFPGGSGGEVTVILEHDPTTGAVCLRVIDNGVGLPAELDWRQSSSLGLRLVQMLAKQMRGAVQTGPGPGTEFQVRFNVNGSSS